MAEFVLQQNPEVAPKFCYFCGTHAGPFVNTMTFDNAGRIILVCAPDEKRGKHTGCAGLIAKAAGCTTVKETQDLRVEVARANVRAEQAETRLGELRDSVVEAVA